VLAVKFDAWFAWITLAALVLYITFTVLVTEWRTKFRREANEFDSAAHTKAVDSLLNYETVKYFNNEGFEARRYDESLERLRRARLKSQTTLSMLNTGQQLIIAVGLVAMLWRATQGVVDGRMTLGDLVMVNAFMIQLYIPLNFLGVIYREIKQSLTDLDKMFVLMDKEREVADAPGAQPLRGLAQPTVRFEDVHFAYDPGRRRGPSCKASALRSRRARRWRWSGPRARANPRWRGCCSASTTSSKGRITIAGQEIRSVTQASVRQAIGIVPQDTVLFNDTVAYNIAYGRPGATQQEVEAAARAARIHDFIAPRPRATPPWWASGASSSRAAKSSAWRLPARCSRTHPS
jgi:ABC-type transport system involved in Fe-S cluster assembly fused permease/ATPase subunit